MSDAHEEKTITDVDGNEVTSVKFRPDDITQFGALLINTLFGNGIKDDTPPETRTQMLAEIQSLCLIRGIDSLNSDLDRIDGDMKSALTQYDRKVTGHIQSAANTLYSVEKDDELKMSDADMAMLDFLKSKGVKHMQESRREAIGPIAGLIQQLMRNQGDMSDEEFGESIHEQLDALLSKDKPTPGCDCPGCQMKTALLAKAKGSVVAETAPSPENDAPPPPTATQE